MNRLFFNRLGGFFSATMSKSLMAKRFCNNCTASQQFQVWALGSVSFAVVWKIKLFHRSETGKID